MSAAFFRALARDASRRYADRFARHFAYFKLTGDPVFRHLVQSGVLVGRERLLDIGCGQGMLEALLAAASSPGAARAAWPPDWPPLAVPRAIVGIDLDARAVARARLAADARACFLHDDIRNAVLREADAILILDVLHYMERAEQDATLERVRRALAPAGVLLLRVADAKSSMRFRATIALDRLSLRLRGGKPGRYHCRPLADWVSRLASLGLQVEQRPMSAGTPFANVLLVARPGEALPATAPIL